MIEVKITGNSIPELADKLLAIGNSLRRTSIADANTAAAITMQAERDAARLTLPEIIQAEAEKIAATKRSRKKAEAAPVTVVEDEPAEQADTDTGEVTEVPALETVTAAVLSAVERVGRDKVVAILAQFGVNRASEVAPAQRAELLAMVKDA